MRLFIAIDLDQAARAAIAVEQARLKKAIGDRSSLKWVRDEQMHLTLVFLGEVPENRAPRLIDTIERPIDQPPFEASFEGIGTFPPRGAPRVLWIGVAAGAQEMIAVQRELAGRVRQLEIAVEDRTLARWRESGAADRTRVGDAARATTIARIRVGHATLYRSRLSPSGSTYTPLARATLSA
ncbi:MAG: RNA 2',3'-cyclic phosphodiesterase [Acidobacteria bacterium]|nr:MAG: RNA 2',3'-cyclic phosphodiesterase [Acidobacteriota bacterium]